MISARKHRGGREGYAVLLVFAMAATIAISLYLELPRAAFEAQRDKEQLLIDRGEAYSRAVQLYVRKFNRFPPDFDALNNTQNIRFLRRQYSDPMTGKDEWRVVHVGPGGVFVDSLVYGAKKADDKNAPQTFITELQPVGGNTGGASEGVNLATRRRASDAAGAPGDPGNPSQPGTADPSAPGQPPPNGPVQVLPDGRIVPVNLGSQNGAMPGGTALPGQPGANPGAPFSGSPNQPFPQQFPGQQPNPGNPGQPNAPPTAAANLINQLLTNPRPGGFPGQPGAAPAVDQFGNPLQPTANGSLNPPPGQGTTQSPFGTPVQAAAPQGQVIGGGIAGVASKREQEGIKVYNGRTDYKEWEFVYDISKDKTRAGAGLPGAQNVPPPQNGNQPNAAPGSQPNSPPLSGFPPGVTPPLGITPRTPPPH